VPLCAFVCRFYFSFSWVSLILVFVKHKETTLFCVAVVSTGFKREIRFHLAVVDAVGLLSPSGRRATLSCA
jgi:hypothetical protein